MISCSQSDHSTCRGCSSRPEWTARRTGSQKSRKKAGITALIRPIGLFWVGLKVSTRLQIVKTFLLRGFTYGFPLYQAKKVKKKEYEHADRLIVNSTFKKRFSIQPELSLLNLEPKYFI